MVNSCLHERFFETAQKGGAKKSFNLLTSFQEKKTLLIMVFANLIVQLGITYYVFLNTQLDKYKKYTWVIALSLFVLIFIIAFVPMPLVLKWILFCIFSILEGLLLSVIKTPTNSSLIQGAILSSVSIFCFFVFVGVTLLGFGIKLGNKIGLILFLLLFLLLIFQLVSIFFVKSSTMMKIFAYLGLILFSAYIIYDTNRLMQRNYNGDFVTASLDYYLDFINIFIDIFNIQNSF
jgi:modulator of FtsH protease